MAEDQVLHMNGGDGEGSYAQNARFAKQALVMGKGVREEAIQRICRVFSRAKCLAMAELGCSSGPNGLVAAGELMRAMYELQSGAVNVEVFWNDLPGNDFNTTFKALPGFKEQFRQEIGDRFGRCFFYGVPSSFHDRLFRPNTLHFVHSSYALHYLSQVPKEVGRSNKNNIYLSSDSPMSVVEAYYQQFRTDFSNFLRYRSDELVEGGCMVFTLLGRKDDPSGKGSGFMWEPLAFVLQQMVSEGLISEEDLDTFNVPMYMPSSKEIEIEVNNIRSFEVNCIQVSEIDWEFANIDDDAYMSTPTNSGMIKCLRSVTEPMLSHHFGQALMDQVFDRYGLAIADCMAKEKLFFTNITFSLIKRM